VHGLAEGERFQVLDGGEPDGAAKAEIVVTAVEDQSAVAEIAALYDPTCRLQPGDRLRRLDDQAASPSAPAEEVVEVAGRQVRVIADEVTGLACHRSFMDLFRALCGAGGEFAAALVQVEGLEGVREALGRVGSDALLRALAAAAREVFPSSALLGRFAPDTLGVLLPATGADEARELAAKVIARVQDDTQRTLRAGVAAHPCPGFEATQTLDNAAKALVHAGFLEPGAAVVFDAVSLNISGDALFARGRIAEAVAEYERALGLDPAEPNVLNSLGVCYGHLGQMDKAMDCFQRALAAAPEDFMAYYNLGYALMAQGRLAEARQRFQQCLERQPDHADTLFQLGRLAQGEGRLAEALELFTRAAEQPDCRPAVHRHLGEALAAMGKPAEAEEAFKRAVKINPDDAAALSSLAELYLARGANTEIALSLARRARELEPAAARHLRVLSQALLALERLDEAEALLDEAVAAHPDDPFLALQQARLEQARGRPAAARDAYRRALALEPNLAEARQGLAALEE
jgi:tetratricopeptide (TPR) repeat protein